jgi:Spy/CpxP family protein refolding chaperone
MSSQVKPWLLLSVIFIVGIVTGSALTIGLGPHFMHPSGEQQIKRHLMEHLAKRLNLTADQQAKIQPIVADAATKLQALQRDEVEQGSQIFKAANEQISALLTPEQKVEMQKMESEREKMFSGHMRPWGPSRDGPGGMRRHGGPDDDGRMPPPAPDATTNAAPPGPAPSP